VVYVLAAIATAQSAPCDVIVPSEPTRLVSVHTLAVLQHVNNSPAATCLFFSSKLGVESSRYY
jgi:hypothetical protein